MDDDDDAARLDALASALTRLNVKLLGAPWCEKCAKQRELLRRVVGSDWAKYYVDCALAQRCAHCVGAKEVPTWVVDGERYPGVFDVQTLERVVGVSKPGARKYAIDRAIASADEGAMCGGLKLGELRVRARDRRTRRRSGWAKRAAIALAKCERGRFWCEFGELLTPRISALAREAVRTRTPLRPA